MNTRTHGFTLVEVLMVLAMSTMLLSLYLFAASKYKIELAKKKTEAAAYTVLANRSEQLYSLPFDLLSQENKTEQVHYGKHDFTVTTTVADLKHLPDPLPKIMHVEVTWVSRNQNKTIRTVLVRGAPFDTE